MYDDLLGPRKKKKPPIEVDLSDKIDEIFSEDEPPTSPDDDPWDGIDKDVTDEDLELDLSELDLSDLEEDDFCDTN